MDRFLVVVLVRVAAALVPVASAMAQPRCPGDFGGDEQVTVDEIVVTVNHALNGCPVRFVDNGDGTITDRWTGLLWEKKSDDGSIHDKDDLYTWSESGEASDGTVFTDFLPSLNELAFAGYTDWRLPTRQELETLLNIDRYEPSTEPAFDSECVEGCSVTECSCTANFRYWSSSVYVPEPQNAWRTGFANGASNDAEKVTPFHARAVRLP